MNAGTNIPAGLQLAKNMLEGDTTVADARKYMVLVSDGDTYLFCHETANGDYDYTKSYTRAGPSERYIGGVSEYENYDINVPVRNKYLNAKDTLDTELWQDYLNYVGTHNQNFTQYDFQASADAFNAGKFPDGVTNDLLIPYNVTDRIIDSDVPAIKQQVSILSFRTNITAIIASSPVDTIRPERCCRHLLRQIV